jgi:hypothetical protein
VKHTVDDILYFVLRAFTAVVGTSDLIRMNHTLIVEVVHFYVWTRTTIGSVRSPSKATTRWETSTFHIVIMEDQECKCYKVLSTKPLTHKGQIFDMLASFLRKDRESHLHLHHSSSFTTEEGDEDKGHDQHLHHHLNELDRDLIRERASWNELRQWANELIEEESDETNSSKKQVRRLIEAWKDQQQQEQTPQQPLSYNDRYEHKRGEAPDDVRSRLYFPPGDNQSEIVHEENQKICRGLIKVEAMESTGRAEVSMVGRSAAELFEDHLENDLDDSIEDERQLKKLEAKATKRAQKKEKKQAKKAKKEAKKKAKEDSTKHKRHKVAVKMEE